MNGKKKTCQLEEEEESVSPKSQNALRNPFSIISFITFELSLPVVPMTHRRRTLKVIVVSFYLINGIDPLWNYSKESLLWHLLFPCYLRFFFMRQGPSRTGMNGVCPHRATSAWVYLSCPSQSKGFDLSASVKGAAMQRGAQ